MTVFSNAALAEGSQAGQDPTVLLPPIGGLNSSDVLAGMPLTDAVELINWMPYPDRVEMRYGAANHVTGFVNPVRGLHEWVGSGAASEMFATTDAGIYDVTTAGAVGAAVAAITNGLTRSVNVSTGGTRVLMIVNGTDNLQQYDGTTWTAPAAFGGLNSNTIWAIEVYKRRVFFSQQGTLLLWYLAPNAIAGAATSYDLGAIFRRGGSIQAVATWTIDSGDGPDDHLVVMTNQGEIAVFTGYDPAVLTDWFLKGVYYLGTPIGDKPLYKYGGEVLVLADTGIYPLSQALQTASIDRTQALSSKIRQLFARLAGTYSAATGWQMVNVPEVPMLVVNIPNGTDGYQLAMHSQSGAWTRFAGWVANCFIRTDAGVFFGGSTFVAQCWIGAADFGANIEAWLLQAYSNYALIANKRVTMVRSTFFADGTFTYTFGFSSDFKTDQATENTIVANLNAGSLWGTGVWGTALWAGLQTNRTWRAVPDVSSYYKAFALQVASNTTRVSYQVSEILLQRDGVF